MTRVETRKQDVLAIGGAYSTKIYMTRFDESQGLFAGQGNIDVPEN
jgi:hypothetical protein